MNIMIVYDSYSYSIVTLSSTLTAVIIATAGLFWRLQRDAQNPMIPGVGHQQSLPLAAEGHGRGTVQLVQLLPPAPEEQLPLALAATPTQQPVVEGVGDQQGTAALGKVWTGENGEIVELIERSGKSMEIMGQVILACLYHLSSELVGFTGYEDTMRIQ